ncbi:MAG: hypothetical protein ACK4ST_14090, partial [Elioraea tepidiphila]
SVVLRVIEGLQNDLFRALTRADLAVVAREAPARHAARFTTDAALIREAERGRLAIGPHTLERILR